MIAIQNKPSRPMPTVGGDSKNLNMMKIMMATTRIMNTPFQSGEQSNPYHGGGYDQQNPSPFNFYGAGGQYLV